MLQVVPHAATADDEELPAWSLPRLAANRIAIDNPLPERVDREWALGGATGAGVKVCILDSGVEFDHPLVGPLAGAVSISLDEEGAPVATEDAEGDLCGHGTACAGVVHSIAPEAELYSVRVLGAGFAGTGPVLLAGLRWAVAQRFDVVNMSLSTTKRQFGEVLHELADTAYFRGTILVASAHNMPVESYPWRFSSVLSVGATRRTTRSSTTRIPIRPSSSSRAGSTSTSPGSAAARSGPPATASRRRASRGSRR